VCAALKREQASDLLPRMRCFITYYLFTCGYSALVSVAEITGIITYDDAVISEKSIEKVLKEIVMPRICMEEPKRTREPQSG
jgi:hypothetical protein